MVPPSLMQAISLCPYLASPTALGFANTSGKFMSPPHVRKLNHALMDAWATPNSRLAVNMPFQHGKSELSSVYFPAWVLMLWPETRIVLASYEERFSGKFGGRVREIIARFGGPHGITLRQDTKAKNEWVIDGHEGGMVCKGRKGAVVGRPADLLLMDDMIKDAEEAMSATILDGIWDWYSTVAYSRLGPTAPIVSVGTRWVGTDLFGRIFAEAKQSSEVWNVIKFKAIAEKDDVLGRQPGEALWPARVPLSRLEFIKRNRPRWFQACWQQEPEEETGFFFRPDQWPMFIDIGGAFRPGGFGSPVVMRGDCYIFATVDWARTEKDTSDFTAIAVWALTGDMRLLLLHVVNERVRMDECPRLLDRVCRDWSPQMVAGEDDVLSLAMLAECRRQPHIPEIRALPIGNKSKLQRAMHAITWCENGRVMRPKLDDVGAAPSWWEEYKTQLAAFTGTQSGHDDMVDVTGIACRLAEQLKGYRVEHEEDYGVELIGGGKGSYG